MFDRHASNQYMFASMSRSFHIVSVRRFAASLRYYANAAIIAMKRFVVEFPHCSLVAGEFSPDLSNAAMDLEGADVRTLDVFRRVSRVSFCYFSDEEARALSVQRLIRSSAFDDLGRPVPSGLYDIALGPTSYTAGACPTCGLSYSTCPGHFGHIELPVPLVHPLLLRDLYSLIQASCWGCARIKHSNRTKRLLLARLRFEHVADIQCSEFVQAYRLLSMDRALGNQAASSSREEKVGTLHIASKLLKNLLQDAPLSIAQALRDVDIHDEIACDEAVSSAALSTWTSFQKEGRLCDASVSEGWNSTISELLLLGKTVSKCPICLEKNKTIGLGENGSFYFGKSKSPEAILSTFQIEQHLKRLWENESELMDLVFGLKGRRPRSNTQPLDHGLFFLRTVLVPPSRFRPSAAYGNTGLAAEHPQNVFFQRILLAIEALIDLQGGDEGFRNTPGADNAIAAPFTRKTSSTRSKNTEAALFVSEMQQALNNLYDSSGDANSKNPGAFGIRQQLETKQGLFRMHMMGKRVNFSCRSVIGPDVFLDTNEVGIPESFAKLLTVPETVTPLNVERLRKAVLNGPDKYPGANAIEDWSRNGTLQTVRFRSSQHKRLLLAQSKLLLRNATHALLSKKVPSTSDGASYASSDAQIDYALDSGGQGSLPKRVLRHLRTGDIVLFNRQPTLHRVSMMAHRVRILPDDRTIRFHYANCRSYNADFDGDEMNIHVPQDEIAKSEAHELMLCDRHYVAPTSGAPIRDLIQDHILSAALISKRDTFFTRDNFAQLLYVATERIMSGLNGSESLRYKLPMPAILRPHELWTGKQLLSAVLDAIRGDRPGLCLESQSRVKADRIGVEESFVLFRNGELLRGVLDKNAFGANKHGVVHAVQEMYGNDAAGALLSAVGRLCTSFLRYHGHTTGVDDLILTREAEEIRQRALTDKLCTIGDDASKIVQNMFADEENFDKERRDEIPRQDSSELKRNTLESLLRSQGAVAESRLDLAMTAKLNSLSSDVNCIIPSGLLKKFPHNGFALMTDTGAKGSTVNSSQISCLLGSTIMEGKRVPRMGGSGATLPCFSPYDSAPNAGGYIASRFLTGIAPYEFFFHAMAGREGLLDTSLKTANSGYLQRCLVKHLEGVSLHYDQTTRDSDGSILQMRYGDDGVDPCKASWLLDNVSWQIRNMPALILNLQEQVDCFMQSMKLRDGDLSSTGSKDRRDIDENYLTANISPRFKSIIDSSLTHVQGNDYDLAWAFLHGRYARAAAEPGDPVGVIAAQSVGEPSTQMTLNTFHHAGSESKHVTLGIPRLRELLMTASRFPKTPSMTLPILSNLGSEGAREVSKRFANIAFADILERICIKEGGIFYVAELGGVAVRKYGIQLHLPDEKMYAEELGFGMRKIRSCVKALAAKLHALVAKEIKRLSSLDDNKLKTTKSGSNQQASFRDVADDLNEIEVEHEKSGKFREPQLGRSRFANKNARNHVIEDDFESDGLMDDEDDEEDDRSDMDDFADDCDSDQNDIDCQNGTGVEFVDRDQEKSPIEDRSTLSKEEFKDMNALGRLDCTDSIMSPRGEKRRQVKPDSKKGKISSHRISRDAEVDSTSVPITSQGMFGKVREIQNGRIIEFSWIVPQERSGQLRLAELVLETAKVVKLAHVEGISKCFTEEVSAGETSALAVATEGSNLPAAIEHGYGFVDLNRISTNDMVGILECYGVEAMRASLIEELKKIFDAYGIDVDVRHLSLIADYMTAHGGYRGFNRGAMLNVPSLFQQMSFETTMHFLSKAVKLGRSDNVLNGPSLAIAVGEVCPGGTGSFDLLSRI